ncbi:ASKHA domain-containing protein [Haloimpatiens sp. FM7330]|uniref:ASKHA domain-containing protein n=1 Tax=Haloimpatiens sp. FM7330 TaxID=3298610 RepID=UPI00363395B1
MPMFTDFKINLRKQNILKAIDCYENSPAYDMTLDMYSDFENKINDWIDPVGVYTIINKNDYSIPVLKCYSSLICCFVTLGEKISNIVNNHFSNGEYLEAMLLDAMSDDILFQLSSQLFNKIYIDTSNNGLGLSTRYSPGDNNFSMEYQSFILENIKKKETLPLDVSLSESYMFTPLKSLGFIYGADKNIKKNKLDHDCSRCNNTNCKFRTSNVLNIEVHTNNEIKNIKYTLGNNIMNSLLKNNILISNPCGGNGICGKCKIKVLNGTLPPSNIDKKFFSNKEIDEGYRLACEAYPTENLTISIRNNSSNDFKILTSDNVKLEVNNPITQEICLSFDYDSINKYKSTVHYIENEIGRKLKFSINSYSSLSKLLDEQLTTSNNIYLKIRNNTVLDIYKKQTPLYGIAIDIGSTTLALSLLNMHTGEVIDNYSLLNSQRQFGYDVITRIQYTMNSDSKVCEMKNLIVNDLKKGINALIQNNKITKEYIYDIVLSGNTTMIQFLLGLHSKSLSISPFIMITHQVMHYSYSEVFNDNWLSAHIHIMPCAAAYVGGDITSGILYSKLYNSEKIQLLIDIGTNGEMVIGNKDKIFCAATAAGPAFEGGKIEDGIGSVKGAISEVHIYDKSISLKTIEDAPPCGICGTGIVDLISELCKENIIDKTGFLQYNYTNEESKYVITENDTGENIGITQKDIREIQLAKSAVRAGLEVLIKNFNCTYKDIDKLYIAGGFGNNLHIDSAVNIGLFPKELRNKVTPIGNSSLEGCKEFLLNSNCRKTLCEIIKKCNYIELSNNPDFNELFIENMIFPTL